MSLAGLRLSGPVGLEFVGQHQSVPILELLHAELAEFEAVFGGPAEIVADASGHAVRWVIRDGSGPTLSWDPTSSTITSTANDVDQFRTTLNLLHTLAWSDDLTISDAPEAGPAAIADRIEQEIANTFPSFEVRGLDWRAITAEHRAVRSLDGPSFERAIQSWVAELGDAHTAVKAAHRMHNPPYRAVMNSSGALLVEVPEFSDAYAAGVRAGWVVEVADPAMWLASTGATPQQHAQVAARRFLAMRDTSRRFTAHDPSGAAVSWTETARSGTLAETMQHSRNSDGRHLVRLRHFDASLDLDTAFTEVFAAARGTDELILDLRGNVGGSLATATRLRDRFLRSHTSLGSIRFTTGTGRLSEPTPLSGEPSDLPRWHGRLRVLTDAMTYSAAEDFLLGLQGLEHVVVAGQPTGGGSGRPRSVPITRDLTLSISTALTYDRTGRCIEYNGIPTDRRG
jgi:carboxyl-terminal processing protease